MIMCHQQLISNAVVLMRRSRTASCHACLTVNGVLLGQSTWDATWDACRVELGRQSQHWVEIGAVYNSSCKPQSCQKQKDKYSTDNIQVSDDTTKKSLKAIQNKYNRNHQTKILPVSCMAVCLIFIYSFYRKNAKI